MKKLNVLLIFFGLMAFITGMTAFVFNGILDILALDLNISIASSGLLSTSNTLGAALGTPLTLLAFSKVNRKKLIISLLVAGMISLFGITVASNFTQLLIFRFINGLTFSSYVVLSVATIISLADPKKRGRSVSYLAMGTNVALIIGIPLTRILADVMDWRIIFYGLAIGTGLIAVYFAYALPKPQNHNERLSLKDDLSYLKSLRVLFILLFTFTMFISFSALFTYVTPFITLRFATLIPWMSLILVAVGLATLIGSTIGGRLNDKVGYSSAMLIGGILRIIFLASLLIFARNMYLTIVFVFLASVAEWIIGLQMNLGIVQNTHHEANFVLSLNSTAAQFGLTFGSVFAAIAISNYGIASIVWIALASAVLSVGLHLFARKNFE